MKHLTTTLVIAVICGGAVLAQPPARPAPARAPAAATGNSADDELRQIENDWVAAAKSKDADKIAEILADSWTGINWDGQIEDKARALADLKSPGNSLDTIEMGPMKVRIFGSTAIVNGSDTEKSMDKGKDTSGKYVWMDVFVKQNGKWRAVASESTRVAK
jgi:ketosteroid isomerase-like protein